MKKKLELLNEVLENLSDFENMGNDKLLLIDKKNRKLLINNPSFDLKKRCYESIARDLNIVENKKFKDNNIWTNKEIELLKENSNKLSLEDLERLLKKTKYQILYMKGSLKLYKRTEWETYELEYLVKNLHEKSYILAEKMNRSLSSIKSKKRVLKLQIKKCKGKVIKLNSV